MTESVNLILSILMLLGIIICVVLLSVILTRKSGGSEKKIVDEISSQNAYMERTIKNLFENLYSSNKQLNDFLLSAIKEFNQNQTNNLSAMHNAQNGQLSSIENRLNEILKDNEARLNRITDIINSELKNMQEKNEVKLEQMRQTVDEKLSSTLEKRLSESVKIITQGLDVVSKGIGEMQTLANGVGDLKRVLTNVKTRGGWGEVQLSTLLEQTLAPNQYSEQVQIKPNSTERVDFAILLPGKNEEKLYLPVDAKFPLEDYSRLVSAVEQNDVDEIDRQIKNLETRIKDEAKSISEKYICPPVTTDFAVMYLPVEGLYAEVVRRPALVDILQHKYKIMVCGPTTITALLSSLQMGFKTLAIEKRSSEIWNTLSVFKAEFNKFVDLLSKTQKKIEEASTSLEFATKKTKTIQRKLKDVADIDYTEQQSVEFDEEQN